jgi:hypothetical protein
MFSILLTIDLLFSLHHKVSPLSPHLQHDKASETNLSQLGCDRPAKTDCDSILEENPS